MVVVWWKGLGMYRNVQQHITAHTHSAFTAVWCILSFGVRIKTTDTRKAMFKIQMHFLYEAIRQRYIYRYGVISIDS